MDVQKYIRLHGKQISVSDEVYELYHKTARKARYFAKELKYRKIRVDTKNESVLYVPAREDSLDRLMDDNAEQFADRHESVEDMVLRRISIERLYKALDRLTEKERKLIEALFFEEMTEREVAHSLGISQPAVHKQKNKILKKLKLFLEN